MVREYLFCALRDKYQEEVAQVRAAYALTNATYDMAVQGLNQSVHETRLEYESQIHATEHMYIAQIAAIQAEHEQQVAALEQQMRSLRCPNPPNVAHADVTGDFSFGGAGITYTCKTGYHHDGDASSSVTSSTLTCSSTGTWETTGGGLLNCLLVNPCSAEEDDCDELAECAHTGPGQHTCECMEGTAFGTGEWCSLCSSGCDVGQIQTATCTSTHDVTCEAVQAVSALPDIPGATLTYSNGMSFPTTGTYTCGDQTMSRSLLPTGQWEAAGELSCSIPPVASNIVAIYSAADLTQTTGSWPDVLGGQSAFLQGSGGSLVQSGGQNGASGNFQVLRGGPSTQFRTEAGLWGDNAFTFFFLTRYSQHGGHRGRIMNGDGNNWLSGRLHSAAFLLCRRATSNPLIRLLANGVLLAQGTGAITGVLLTTTDGLTATVATAAIRTNGYSRAAGRSHHGSRFQGSTASGSREAQQLHQHGCTLHGVLTAVKVQTGSSQS